MARDYAALPYEYLTEMEELDDAEFGRLMRALMRYSLDGTPIAPEGNERFYARRVMTREDRYQKNYSETVKARSEAGRRGALSRWSCKADDGTGMEEMAGNGTAITDPAEDGTAISIPAEDGSTINAMAEDGSAMANDGKDGKNKSKSESESESDVVLTVPDGTVRRADARRVMQAWNSLGLTHVERVTSDTERGRMLKKRLADYGIEKVLQAVENVRTSPYLNGANRTGWAATFDWFLKPNNFAKVLSGNYAERDAPRADPHAYDAALWLADHIARRVKGYNRPNEVVLWAWAAEIDALHREGVTWKQISDAMVFANEDEFWQTAILTGADVRQQYNRLAAQMGGDRDAV